MVLGLLKWLKETLFYERKKYKDMNFAQKEGKSILRRKRKFMSFRIKEKLILRVSGGKRRSFST